MVEITYQMVLSTLQTVGILVGIIYYLIIMRNSQKTRELTLESQELTRKAQEQALETRQLQLYTNSFQPAQNREWLLALIDVLYNQEWEDYEDFIRKYGPGSNPGAYASMIQVIELFQIIGLYVEQKALDIDFVNRHSGNTAIRLWEKVEQFVRGHRLKTDDPDHWRSFEYLSQELDKHISEKNRS